MSSLVHTLRGLLAYTIWADRQVLRVLEEVPEADLVRETGTSHGSVLGTFAHVLGSEQVWLSRFLGVPLRRVPGIEDFPSLAILSASFEDFWPQLEFFLASLEENHIAADFTWTNSKGETYTAPYRQALLHVVNHSSYHRGQIAGQLRQLGHRPPATDLVYWRGDL